MEKKLSGRKEILIEKGGKATGKPWIVKQSPKKCSGRGPIMLQEP